MSSPPLPPAKPSDANMSSSGGASGLSSSSSTSQMDLRLNTASSTARLKPEGTGGALLSSTSLSGLSSGQRVSDCCIYLIHCTEHNRLLVAQQEPANNKCATNGSTNPGPCLWLPFIQLPANRSWKESTLVGFCLILAGGSVDSPTAAEMFTRLKARPPYKKFTTMQVYRLQMPQMTQKFHTRLVCYFQLSASNDMHKECCQKKLAPHLEWLPLRDLCSNDTGPHKYQAMGPELAEFAKLVQAKTFRTKVAEYSLEEALLYVPREPPRNMQEEMLLSLRITEKDVERLYADFLEHTLPALRLTLPSFMAYMRKHHLIEASSAKMSSGQQQQQLARLQSFFAAFNTSHTGSLSFHELLLGLVCADPNTPHGELRARSVFRYYDKDKSGGLSEDELKQLLADMHPPEAKEKLEEKELTLKVTEIMRQLGGNKDKEVSLMSFLSGIDSHRLRGTSILCRLPRSIFSQMSRMMAVRNLRKQGGGESPATSISNVIFKRNYNEICTGCLAKKYELAAHLVKIDFSGQLESQRLTQVVPTILSTVASPSVTQTNEPLSKAQQQHGQGVDQEKPKSKPRGSQREKDTRTSHQYSIECVFSDNSAANQIINLVREFNPNKGTTLQPAGLLQDAPEALFDLIQQLTRDMATLLAAEDRCHRVFSPCFVMGDIHGNLEDLLSLERSIWKQMPVVGPNYLFLGDYVDRGKWGIECALYLIAFKVLCPNKVTLLRGNHEVRALQAQYSYKRECMEKYGDRYGLRIWQITNSMFDKLPICAIVDDAIFCAHGGIPRSVADIATLNQMPRDLVNPERQSKAAWEMLWSDPCPQHQFESFAEAYDHTGDAETTGFLHNFRRGTAFLFNEKGATDFLTRNGLTHIIRAHEVAPYGYTFNFSTNQCVTIFSTSHYCGNDNDAACILADNQRMRLIVLDTTNNASGTDPPL